METNVEQTPASPTSSQTPVKTWLPSSTRGATRTLGDTTSRFHGDGVRYKAKLIGVDPVPSAEGEKMCWDSMMKLKGIEVASRKQGKHKQRVWLQVSSAGLKMVDERTGAEIQTHDRSKISSLTKDESDPRALAYVYEHQEDIYYLYYIKTANLADPVLGAIREVCQGVHEQTQEPVEAPPQQDIALLPLDETSPPPGGPRHEDVFSPRPASPPAQSKPLSPAQELMQVFSVQMEKPMTPDQIPHTSPPVSEAPLPPALSNSQILSMFAPQPAGSPPYSPTAAMPWGQQGILGGQWAGPVGGPVGAPWPSVPGSVAAWPPATPPAGSPGQVPGMRSPASPTVANGYQTPSAPLYPPTRETTPQAPTSQQDFLL
ncbi:disabled homolog 1-like [Sphaeramia orbicularis]|uniref:disabled homolog 1-like n=1 Tax=Sphaeramia orbicularis TaxID=375764 RepID=UPI00117F9B92|nr:disabled homolog 1-like [Sphaeramia orbicularis]